MTPMCRLRRTSEVVHANNRQIKHQELDPYGKRLGFEEEGWIQATTGLKLTVATKIGML